MEFEVRKAVQNAHAALASQRKEAQYQYERLGNTNLAERMFSWADTIEAAITALEQAAQRAVTRKRVWPLGRDFNPPGTLVNIVSVAISGQEAIFTVSLRGDKEHKIVRLPLTTLIEGRLERP